MLSKVGIKGNFQPEKEIYEKPTSNILLNDEILKAFPQEQDNDVLFYHYHSNCFADPSQYNEGIKLKKKNWDWERSKPIFTEEASLYIGNPKEFIKNIYS